MSDCPRFFSSTCIPDGLLPFVGRQLQEKTQFLAQLKKSVDGNPPSPYYTLSGALLIELFDDREGYCQRGAFSTPGIGAAIWRRGNGV
jgi:hypothetical protein